MRQRDCTNIAPSDLDASGWSDAASDLAGMSAEKPNQYF